MVFTRDVFVCSRFCKVQKYCAHASVRKTSRNVICFQTHRSQICILRAHLDAHILETSIRTCGYVCCVYERVNYFHASLLASSRRHPIFYALLSSLSLISCARCEHNEQRFSDPETHYYRVGTKLYTLTHARTHSILINKPSTSLLALD